MTLEVRTRGKPPAAARELEARYKEGLPGEWMRYSHWGLHTTVLTLQQNLRFRVVCKLNGLICVNRISWHDKRAILSTLLHIIVRNYG